MSKNMGPATKGRIDSSLDPEKNGTYCADFLSRHLCSVSLGLGACSRYVPLRALITSALSACVILAS